MGGKAAQELQDLGFMQQHAENQAANVNKVMSGSEAMSSAGEAGFAFPEALATGIGAAWLLGPAGLLLGVAQGILVKKEEQNAIDAYAAQSEAITDSQQVIFSEIDRQMLAANPEDLDTLSGIRSMVDYAGEMATVDPERSAQAIETAYANLNAMQVKNDEQAVSQRVLDAQIKRDLGQEGFNRHSSLLTDFENDSANFEAQVQSANNVIEAVNRGDGAALTAALGTMPLLINPQAGATSEGEVDIWRSVRGKFDSLVGMVQKELGSGGMTDATRKELIQVAEQYKRNAYSQQQFVESRAGQRAVTEEIPEKYWSLYNKSGKMPGLAGGGFVKKDIITDAAIGESVDAAVAEVVQTLGLDKEPTSLEEQAETNPRVRRAIQ